MGRGSLGGVWGCRRIDECTDDGPNQFAPSTSSKLGA